ncbi:hypothetical protein WD_0368 [Wolbachia endosymbiont of Drosophila melanogaster]|uniref:hypothetical protein n=1 Tax=Wolbachia TaxID=953 RepID=UPI000023B9A9|nr:MULTISPECIES: hypothetical protein [Wolbachia]POG50230.1 hypothetical protein BK222_01455 [Wolbachia sp. wMel_AMD]POG51150.1 hypothetical protein BKP65_01555 [Wolbachia sp. wMel_KL]AAS14097.1 hypothetical protein WD_0368 [Wolbachia endosymbiont of Drosophila melanogaster]MCE4149880.1 hypothetical protein [Wolbachia endosymbiont of Drosophila melanogaster]MCE4150365.1 hypothetical protein [Wolbachia endosymbiont of Drosophila melanogaster]
MTVVRVSSQCPDTGIQKSLLVSKQTSIEKRFRLDCRKARFQTGMTSFTMYHIAIVVVKALGSEIAVFVQL